MLHPTRPVRIDVTADVVCPWCLIGTRRLERALSELGRAQRATSEPATSEGASSEPATFELVYHPFLVDPAPGHSAPTRGRQRSKYGNPEPLLRRIEAVARLDGIDLDLSRVARGVSSVGAHTLLRHVGLRNGRLRDGGLRDSRLHDGSQAGSQRALAKALFAAHFLESRDVSSESTLEDIGRAHGFAAGEVSGLLHDPREAELTREQAQAAIDGGIPIAPHVVIHPRVADPGVIDPRLAISGAQSVEVFRSALERALRSAP